MTTEKKYSFVRQMLVLLAVVVLFAILTMVTLFVLSKPDTDPWRLGIAAIILQNVGMFIIPAFITARIFNPGKTFKVLSLDKLPSWYHLLMMLLIFAASMPMMNAIIEWNEGIHLPQWMAGVEQWMRAQEDAALKSTEMIMNISSVGQLLVVIFSLGVLTGMGEELIFRGSLQRLMCESRVNVHVAVWVTAFIFSAIHMQFYGFVPRMLLGAFFGYLLVKSGSLWLPMLAHMMNNSLVAITANCPAVETMPWIGNETTPATVIASTLLTAVGVWLYMRGKRVVPGAKH